jgi:radial spoke head protein 4A
LDEANVFEWAGVGFSKSETFRLSLAVQRLGREYQTSSIRLWGKVLGLGADFYIAEGQLAVVDAVEDPLLEELGGANKFTYWAMKDDGKIY